MSQCFFCSLDIGTWDDFFAKKVMGGNGFQKTQFLQGKNGQNEPENHRNQNLAKMPKSY